MHTDLSLCRIWRNKYIGAQQRWKWNKLFALRPTVPMSKWSSFHIWWSKCMCAPLCSTGVIENICQFLGEVFLREWLLPNAQWGYQKYTAITKPGSWLAQTSESNSDNVNWHFCLSTPERLFAPGPRFISITNLVSIFICSCRLVGTRKLWPHVTKHEMYVLEVDQINGLFIFHKLKKSSAVLHHSTTSAFGSSCILPLLYDLKYTFSREASSCFDFLLFYCNIWEKWTTANLASVFFGMKMWKWKEN